MMTRSADRLFILASQGSSAACHRAGPGIPANSTMDSSECHPAIFLAGWLAMGRVYSGRLRRHLEVCSQCGSSAYSRPSAVVRFNLWKRGYASPCRRSLVCHRPADIIAPGTLTPLGTSAPLCQDGHNRHVFLQPAGGGAKKGAGMELHGVSLKAYTPCIAQKTIKTINRNIYDICLMDRASGTFNLWIPDYDEPWPDRS